MHTDGGLTLSATASINKDSDVMSVSGTSLKSVGKSFSTKIEVSIAATGFSLPCFHKGRKGRVSSSSHPDLSVFSLDNIVHKIKMIPCSYHVMFSTEA